MKVIVKHDSWLVEFGDWAAVRGENEDIYWDHKHEVEWEAVQYGGPAVCCQCGETVPKRLYQIAYYLIYINPFKTAYKCTIEVNYLTNKDIVAANKHMARIKHETKS